MSYRVLDIEADLKYVAAMADSLKAYLLSDELYWPLRRLGLNGTLGGLLLHLHLLSHLDQVLTARQSSRYQTLEHSINEQIERWSVQAEEKAVREIVARLRSWKQFLADCGENPDQGWPEYAIRVEERSMISLLQPVAERGLDDAVQDALDEADRWLESISVAGRLVWDERVEPVFPVELFWWLYRWPAAA